MVPPSFRHWAHRQLIYVTKRSLQLKLGHGVQLFQVHFSKANAVGDGSRLSTVTLGTMSYIAERSILFNATIGNYCSIGPDVRIGVGVHPANRYVSTHPSFYSSHPPVNVSFSIDSSVKENPHTTIGHDVWIGSGALILDGKTIGNGAIVGARAVVTKDVPPYAIVVGAPAKILRYRFDPNVIEALQAVAWWNKSPEWIASNNADFTDVYQFIKNHRE